MAFEEKKDDAVMTKAEVMSPDQEMVVDRHLQG